MKRLLNERWSVGRAHGWLLACSWVCACGETDELQTRAPTPIADSLELVRTFDIGNSLGAPVSLEVAGDLMLITDLLGAPFRVVAADASTGEVRLRFGREGEGPGELLAPYLTGLRPDADGTLAYSLWDQGRNLAEAGLYDPAADSVRLRRSFRLSAGTQQISYASVTDAGFWASTATGAPALVQFDSSGGEVRRFESAAPFDPAAAGPDAVLNRTIFAVDLAQGRAVLGFRYSPRLDLVDLRSGEVTTRALLRDDDSRRPADAPPSQRSGYTDIVLTREFCYGLFKSSDERMATMVHRYSLDGSPPASLALNASVSAIAVVGDSLIYGSIVEPVPAIGLWRLTRRGN